MKFRKDISAIGMRDCLRRQFEKVPDHRLGTVDYPLPEVLMGGYTLFSTKCSSLLFFCDSGNKAAQNNLQKLFGLSKIPSDTQTREILDEVSPEQLRPSFKSLFTLGQRGKALDGYSFLDDYYLLSVDGTGCFSSTSVNCKNCCQKVSKKTGEITYYHQMLCGVLVHPDKKQVIPFCPEPILKGDGKKKNDCERNAASRFLKKFRTDHPHLKTIIVEDGLSSNGPHIRELKELDFKFILGAKPGDHKSLFEFVNGAEKTGAVEHYEQVQDGYVHKFRFINNVPLNDKNSDLSVNFLEYWEHQPGGKVLHWSWVTDIKLTKDNAMKIMRGGRARWKIENETFNTLKNQGYNFEHNFGHGNKNLSVIFTFLMMLAFMVDQLQEIGCRVFQQARDAFKTRKAFWDRYSFFSSSVYLEGWQQLFTVLIEGQFPSFSSG